MGVSYDRGTPVPTPDESLSVLRRAASERRGNTLNGFKDFRIKPKPKSGLNSLMFAVFPRTGQERVQAGRVLAVP